MERLRQELPGLFRGSTATASLLLLLTALALVAADLFVLESDNLIEFALLACLVWAQGAAWLVSGEFELLQDVVLEFSTHTQWTTYLLVVSLPIAVAWGAFGALV